MFNFILNILSNLLVNLGYVYSRQVEYTRSINAQHQRVMSPTAVTFKNHMINLHRCLINISNIMID